MRLCLLLLCILPVWAAPAGDAKKPAGKTAAQPQPRHAEVPAGAKEFEPGAWRYVDAQGKVWLYRRTPFGIMKGEERVVKDDLPPGMKATEDGDSIRFERPSPFGYLKWTKKKTDALNDVERRVFERDCRKAKPAEPGKE